MATVIDSLLIELGLDASKLMTTQKKVVDELKKVAVEAEKTSKATVDSTKKTSVENKKASDQEKKTHDEKKKAEGENKKFGEESTKRAKQTQLDNKNIGESFSKITLAAASFGASLIGLKEIAEFSTNLSLTNASLGRTSQLLGQNPQELQAWGKVFEAGGDAAGAYSNNLGQLLSRISQIKTGDPLLSQLATARIQPSFMEPFSTDPSKLFNILKLGEELKRLEKAETRIYAQAAAKKELNITAEEYLILTQNSTEELKKLLAVAVAKVAVDEKAIKKAQQTQEQVTALDQAFLRMGNNIQETLAPKMVFFRDVLIDIANSFSDLDDKSQKFITNLGSSSLLLATLAGVVGFVGLLFPPLRPFLLPVAVALGTAAIGTGTVAAGNLAYKASKNISGDFSDIETANGLPIGTLAKIRQRESSGDNNAVSRSAEGEVLAEGPFGIRPSTGTMLGLHDREAFDVGKSSNAAGKYLGDLLKKYHDMDKAVAAYNWGPTNVDKKGMGNLPKETSDYISYMHQDNMSGAKINAEPSSTRNNNSSVQTGDIHIHTQATEGAGIGDSLSSHLQNLLVTGSWAGGTN